MNETTSKNKLVVTLPSDLEIRMTRTFDAPRELVFDAFTKCEHMKHWWGNRGSELVLCEMDLRPGGAWRRVVRAPDGSEHPFKGEIREVSRPERVSQTLIYDIDYIRDFESLETAVFEERDGKTYFTATVLHKTKESRDGHVQHGMEKGAAEAFDRLEELLATLE